MTNCFLCTEWHPVETMTKVVQALILLRLQFIILTDNTTQSRVNQSKFFISPFPIKGNVHEHKLYFILNLRHHLSVILQSAFTLFSPMFFFSYFVFYIDQLTRKQSRKEMRTCIDNRLC